MVGARTLLREDSVLEIDLGRPDELRTLAVLVPHLELTVIL